MNPLFWGQGNRVSRLGDLQRRHARVVGRVHVRLDQTKSYYRSRNNQLEWCLFPLTETNKQTQKNKQTKQTKQINQPTKQTNQQTSQQTNKQTKQTNERANIQPNRQTSKQTKQTTKHLDKQIHTDADTPVLLKLNNRSDAHTEI